MLGQIVSKPVSDNQPVIRVLLLKLLGIEKAID